MLDYFFDVIYVFVADLACVVGKHFRVVDLLYFIGLYALTVSFADL